MGCLGVPRAKTYVGNCAKTDRKETTRKPNKKKQGRRAKQTKTRKEDTKEKHRTKQKETTKKQAKKNKRKEHNKEKEQTTKRTTRQTKRPKRRKEEKEEPKHSDWPGSVFFFLHAALYWTAGVLEANSGRRRWGSVADCFIIHTMYCWCLLIISLPSRSGVNEGKQVTDAEPIKQKGDVGVCLSLNEFFHLAEKAMRRTTRCTSLMIMFCKRIRVNFVFFCVVEKVVHRKDNCEHVLNEQMRFSGVCQVFQPVVLVLG